MRVNMTEASFLGELSIYLLYTFSFSTNSLFLSMRLLCFSIKTAELKLSLSLNILIWLLYFNFESTLTSSFHCFGCHVSRLTSQKYKGGNWEVCLWQVQVEFYGEIQGSQETMHGELSLHKH